MNNAELEAAIKAAEQKVADATAELESLSRESVRRRERPLFAVPPYLYDPA